MILTADKLKEARDAGYSDDEIFGFISKSDPKFDTAKSEGYSLDEIATHFSSQQPKPMVERVGDVLQNTAMDLEDAISVIGRLPQSLATQLPAGYQKLVSGTAIPKKSEAIEADLAFQANINKELEDRKASGQIGILGSATREGLPSWGTSLISMGAGLAGGAVGLARGLGNPITAAADAGVASGAVSYRMQGADFLYRAFKQLEDNKGSALTDQEKADAYKELLPLAQKSALWEAGPEAVGNAVSLGVGKFVFGFGKEAATQLAKESGKAVEKTLVRKIAEKSGAVVGGAGTEVGTEAITALSQYGPEMAAKQYAETGTTKGAPTEYPGGIIQAAKDVAPATLATQALFMGAGGAVKLGGLAFEAKPKTPVQLATDNIDIQANKEAVNLSIDPADEVSKGLSETIKSIQGNLVSKKEIYSALEPTDPIAKTLKLEIQDDENRLILMQAELNKRAGVELSEAEKQQIELAKAITTPETAAPTEQVAQPIEEAAAQPIEIPTPVEEAAPVAAPVEQVVTPPVEVAPTIAEPAPVEPATPAPVAEQAAPAEAPAPEVTAVDRYTELSRNPKIGTAKERKALEQTVATTTFKTSRGSTYYILPDGKIRRDKYSGTTSYSDQIAFVSPENAEKIKEIRNEYEEGRNTSVEITPEVIRFRFNEKTVEVPIASQSPQEGLSPFELSGGRYPHLGDPVVSPAPVTEQAAPAEAPAPEVAPKAIKDYATGDINTPFYFEGDSWKVDESRLKSGDEVIETSDGPAIYYRTNDGKVTAIGVNANGRQVYIGESSNSFMPSDYSNVPVSEMFSALKGSRTYESDRAGDLFPAIDQKTAEKLISKYPPTTPTPAVSETITEPEGIVVGNRIKLGKSPQTYTVEEVIPQTESEKANNEQFYSVKNERTGEVQTVEAKDLKKVGGKNVRKAAAGVIPKQEAVTPTPEKDRYTFEQVLKAADKYFGKMIPEGFVIVNDTELKDLQYKAGYDPKTGQIILNLAYINKNESIDDLISHELGHYIFGDKNFKKIFKEFWNLMSPEEKAAFDKIIKQFYNEETGAVKMEEKQVRAFMQLIAESKAQPAWRKLLDIIKRWINEKLKTNFKATDRGALAVLAAAHKRFKSGEQIVREIDSGTLKVAADREKVMGAAVGPEKKTPEGIIAKTQELLRNQFDPAKVSDKNTTEAFRALGRLMGKDGTSFAQELNDIGRVVDESGAASEISMGAALFVNDLFEYAIRLAANGDKKMLGMMMSNINKLPTAAIGASDAARTLRARLELSQRFLTMAQAEQDSYTNYVAEFIYGPNPSKEQIKSIKDAYAAVEKTPQVTEQELTDEIKAVGDRTGTDLVGKINEEFAKATDKGKEKRKTELEELDKEYKKVQNQADAEIEKLAKIQSDTPSFDPVKARQTANDVRAIVAADLKQRPDMGRKAPWKSMLVAKLQEAGVELTAAETLADIVWRQHEINNLSRELSSINKAIEKGPISEIVKAIKETPLEDQQNPNWRYEVMRDYLRRAGLNVAQSERIAKLMDISLQKRFTMAQEQAFTDAISKTAPWKAGDTRSRRAFQKVLQALRAGALDPARNVLSDMAALNGWTGFTPEQYKALLKNDAILSDPEAGELKKAEAYKAIQDVISKAKLPIRARNVIGQYYDAQALSGIPTLTVNSFSPIAFAMRNAIIEIGSGTLRGNPKAITNAATAFVDSIKSWANTVAYSFKNNVTVYSNVDYLVNDEGLLRLYRRGVDQFKGGKTSRERADGVKNMMIGMMDYVRRILNALDYGAIASLQNQNISKYSMAVMKRQGMSTKQANEMFAVMMKAKNDFYVQQIAGGMDKNRASILADEFYISSWSEALSKAGVEKSDIKQAMDAAINDALSSVGRNRQSLDSLKDESTKLKDAGVSSMPALWLLESMANAANQSDNQILKLFSRVIYGFAIVPARVIRETAWFSPYGFVRFGYDAIAKKMNKTSPYAQSLGTDVQYSQRLNEAVAGTVALIALASLRGSSTDEPEEDEFKIVFTGNGPQRKDDAQFYDSWYKAGNKPNSMIVSFGKTKFTLNMMRGFEAFTWPAMMLGALDDLEIRKKQKRETNTAAQIEDASIVAGFVFDAALRRGPYAFTTKSLFGTYGDIGVEGVAKGLTFPAKTLIPILGTSLASNLSNLLNDPIDRRTLDGAVWSNIPFIGPAVAPKSLNAFGEPSLSTDFASKMFKLGVPIVYDIPTDRESVMLHELVLKQGGGPSIPTRNQLAQRLDRQPTNKEYEMFVKEYGAILTKSMKSNYDRLSAMKPELYSKTIERIGNNARDVAERKVRIESRNP